MGLNPSADTNNTFTGYLDKVRSGKKKRNEKSDGSVQKEYTEARIVRERGKK